MSLWDKYISGFYRGRSCRSGFVGYICGEYLWLDILLFEINLPIRATFKICVIL